MLIIMRILNAVAQWLTNLSYLSQILVCYVDI